ncbi:chitin binding domain-containing protein [Nonomuraea sp. FMUSA5-5]|uniref:Chitin binding domain-containing protein n=1 Tax=Nonomuraea composti TaxID=2720023 RepID=A0ABX1AYB1_9ACTN|nr:chitin binding peritrophin-A domain-containing protein [Nonomuraea sp. FMUSA5-5]NJP90595.1 chitin binding domain-containing protein [Nonomuraea sp. FMUSA5-5]
MRLAGKLSLLSALTVAASAGALAFAAPASAAPVGQCPPTNQGDPVYLIDDRYMEVFYECSWGVPTLFVCPTGLVFNPVINVCDYPSNVPDRP